MRLNHVLAPLLIHSPESGSGSRMLGPYPRNAEETIIGEGGTFQV